MATDLDSILPSAKNFAEIVGNSRLPDLTTHAFIWRAGTMIDLGTIAGSSSAASGINGKGQVVGQSTTLSGTRAFLWERAGVSQFFFEYVPGFTPEVFANVQQHYEQWNFWIVFVAAFTPIPYKVITITAGVFGWLAVGMLMMGLGIW